MNRKREAALTLERDAALSALEIARTALTLAIGIIDPEQHRDSLIKLCEAKRAALEPTAALAERDRAIERKTAERCREIAFTSKGYPTELSEEIAREFGLPKP